MNLIKIITNKGYWIEALESKDYNNITNIEFSENIVEIMFVLKKELEYYYKQKLNIEKRELLFAYEKSFESENFSDGDLYKTIDEFLNKNEL